MSILSADRQIRGGEANVDGSLPDSKLVQVSERVVRIVFWTLGLALAVAQSWSYRGEATADAIQYLDMSDGVLHPANWTRLINGIWSPLYAVILGLGRLLYSRPYQEVAIAHYINIAIFVFAFASFEFFLSSLYPARGTPESSDRTRPPRWAILVIAYSIFLWSCVGQVTFKSLRPDMLMDGFVFLAIGVLVRIMEGAGTWRNFLLLGTILGVAYLAKAPMLLIGTLMLCCTMVHWRRNVAKAIAAELILLALGSLYFVPLSKQLGHFSIGESSSYNYLFHVDGAAPSWYLDDPGAGTGEFVRSPVKIFNSPPTHEFHYPLTVTHALRFDPIYWTLGAKPKFTASGQFWAIVENSRLYGTILMSAGGLVAGIALLMLMSGPWKTVVRQSLVHWEVWVIGVMGLTMYVAVHVEDRYVGIFFSLVGLGLLAGIRIQENLNKRVVPAIALGMALALVGPIVVENGCETVERLRNRYPDPSIQVASELNRLGYGRGTQVARVSYLVTDLMWARLAGASVVAEVEYEHGDEFWSAGDNVQQQVLDAFAKTGAKIVVDHVRGDTAPPGWERLGRTRYWLHRLG